MASDAASVRMRDAEPVRDADSDCAVSVLRKSKAGCNEPENHDGYSARAPGVGRAEAGGRREIPAVLPAQQTAFGVGACSVGGDFYA